MSSLLLVGHLLVALLAAAPGPPRVSVVDDVTGAHVADPRIDLALRCDPGPHAWRAMHGGIVAPSRRLSATITVHRIGYVDRKLTVIDPTTDLLEVRLFPAAASRLLEVSCIDDSGAPVGRARVRIGHEGQGLVYGMADDRGTFATRLTIGVYQVTARAEGYGLAWIGAGSGVSPESRAGGLVLVGTAPVSRAALVFDRLVDLCGVVEGLPPGEAVLLCDHGPFVRRPVPRIEIDANGRFHCSVPAGEGALFVQSKGGVTDRVAFRAEPGSAISLRFRKRSP